MGSQLLLNLAESLEEPVAGLDSDPVKAEGAEKAAAAERLKALCFTSPRAFCRSLSRPRTVLLLVPAGKAVDAVLDRLLPLLDRDDVVLDCGNEWFEESERRQKQLKKRGIRFMACGTSGGERGARLGPCLMPSGERAAWDVARPMLEAIAARVQEDGEPVNARVTRKSGTPCVCYIGPGGSGHYVKMVHNGIEYGDMQILAEGASFARVVGGLSPMQLSDLLSRYSHGLLDSFLLEITAMLYRKEDDRAGGGGRPLVDSILDSCGSKGTGKWTVQQAAELGVPCPTMAAALEARYVSSLKGQREAAFSLNAAAPVGGTRNGTKVVVPVAGWAEALEDALLASKICSYAQGLALLSAASREHGWSLHIEQLATIWRGGCIIRARILQMVRNAYENNPALPNLLLDPVIAAEMRDRAPGWRRTVAVGIQRGIPLPALSASLSYYDSFRSAVLPSAQCIQAQRDYFGGHGYLRLDEQGVFHTQWDA